MQSYTNAWVSDLERESEALRVVNEMRRNGEARPEGWTGPGVRRKIWSIHEFDVVTADRPTPILAAVPGEEHLATFLWLFPEDDLTPDSGAPSLFSYLVVLAQLQEQAGERDNALTSYRRLLSEFATEGYNDNRSIRTAENARAAITRLSR